MKNVFLVLMVAFAFNLNADAAGSLELSVTTIKPSKRENSEITVMLKNKGADPIEIPAVINPQNQWLKFELSTDKGEVLQFNGKLSVEVDKKQKLILYPEHYWGRVFKLVDLYPISAKGNYRLRVTYGVGPDGKNILTEPLVGELDILIK